MSNSLFLADQSCVKAPRASHDGMKTEQGSYWFPKARKGTVHHWQDGRHVLSLGSLLYFPFPVLQQPCSCVAPDKLQGLGREWLFFFPGEEASGFGKSGMSGLRSHFPARVLGFCVSEHHLGCSVFALFSASSNRKILLIHWDSVDIECFLQQVFSRFSKQS